MAHIDHTDINYDISLSIPPSTIFVLINIPCRLFRFQKKSLPNYFGLPILSNIFIIVLVETLVAPLIPRI